MVIPFVHNHVRGSKSEVRANFRILHIRSICNMDLQLRRRSAPRKSLHGLALEGQRRLENFSCTNAKAKFKLVVVGKCVFLVCQYLLETNELIVEIITPVSTRKIFLCEEWLVLLQLSNATEDAQSTVTGLADVSKKNTTNSDML